MGEICVYAGKKEGFGRGKRENEFGRKRQHRTIS